MDIGSKNKYPAGKLSNFTAFEFEIDGVKCASMEGFLQALKFENKEAQKSTCSLVGFAAKKKGSGRNKYWRSRQKLWWNGNEYKRSSKEYQTLISRAYQALYDQSEEYRKTLDDAGDAVFTHSIGNKNKKETVLTEREFCARLQMLKDHGRINQE